MQESLPVPHAGADGTASSYDGTAMRLDLAAQLGLTVGDLDVDANLLQLGLDSIDLMHWLQRLRSLGFRISMLDLYRKPTAAGWAGLLEKRARSEPLAARTNASWPTMHDGTAFPLTPVQHAYLVGRSPQQTLGGVGCHLYQEFDGEGLCPDRLDAAIRQLVDRHPMLSVAFRSDGTQHRMERSAWPGMTRHDFRHRDEAEAGAALLALREQLSHRLLDVEAGQTFDLQFVLLPSGRHRLLTSVDLLVADASSYAQIFDELAQLVQGHELSASTTGYDFRSYIEQHQAVSAVERNTARSYWHERMDSLPAAPALPLALEPALLDQVMITRRAHILDRPSWEVFKRHAGSHGLTPTMALATCFASVLSRWCGQSRLLLNFTLFDRHDLHPAVQGMVADFTNVLLLDMCGEGADFESLARENQHTFAAAYEHHAYSGVEVMRELRRRGDYPHGAPVVFTSNLGQPLIGDSVAPVLGEPGWGISQTPQVWIDHMAIEHHGGALLQWDGNDALFPPGLTQALFDCYIERVQQLCADPMAWQASWPDTLPTAQADIRRMVNDTHAVLSDALLHEAFFEHAEHRGSRLSAVHGDQALTHAELSFLARRLGERLLAEGIKPGERVGICMPKGLGQIVGALATLYVGATYVPIAIDQPSARIERICHDAGLSLLLVCRLDPNVEAHAAELHRVAWQDAASTTEHAVSAPLVRVSPDQAAYIIYTSGSTGSPKGVVVSHRAALNTCLDINRRYQVDEDDRVLALSALHFDLSVYDVFGVLGAGGAVVLVDDSQRRDPATWCELIERHRITIWNTVPALFNMLLTYAEGFALTAPSHLRLVLLSGDWVALDLPTRYRAYAPDGRFIAMGGATEAAIWSNAYEVAQVAPGWRSIPYGYPLANQCYRVVDGAGRDCPDWVAGELWIGGLGVALGYFNDEARTQAQFVDADDGRWYRTGDMGCYWPDGTLEFLGRRDKQVKIGGYRIELGEIDAAFARIDGIKAAVSLALGERDKSLAAFVTLHGDTFYRQVDSDPRLAVPLSHALLPSVAPPIEQEDARAVAAFIAAHLRLNGLEWDVALSASEAASRYGCMAEYHALFSRWLDLLVAHHQWERDHAGRYRPRTDFAMAPLGDGRVGDGHATPLDEALLGHHHALGQIMRGLRPAVTLLDHPDWAPEQVIDRLSGTGQTVEALAAVIDVLHARLGRPVRVVEIGARSGLTGERLLGRLSADKLDYLALDESQDMVLRARTRLADYGHAVVHRWHEPVVEAHRCWADLVWANNSVHRLASHADAIGDALALAAPGAVLYVVEAFEAPPQAMVSIDLLTQGQGDAALRDEDYWRACFAAHDLEAEGVQRTGYVMAFILRAPPMCRLPDADAVARELGRQLPPYMVPSRLHFIDALPLTANGKVDYRALMARAETEQVHDAAIDEPLVTSAEHALADVWKRLLDIGSVHRQSHFFQLGGDSLLATRLMGELERGGYAARLGDLFAYPRLAAFAATLQLADATTADTLSMDAASRHEPFALTDLQQAYLVGRQPGFALGGIGSHFFIQFEVDGLDIERFTAAWNRLIARHDMLRAVVRHGMQQVLPEVPAFAPALHRLDDLHGAAALELYERLSHKVHDSSQWPVFDVHVVQSATSIAHVYVSLDNLLLDGMSMQILFAELKQLYLDPAHDLEPIHATFRDYLAHPSVKQSSAESKAYWSGRLSSLPSAPQLPLRCSPAAVTQPRFIRLAANLSAENWRALREAATTHGLTPSSLLLAAYAAVLSAWSERAELSINLTLFDRRPIHPHIDRVMGDFTSLLLLAWQPVAEASWHECANAMQRRLRQDMVHRDVSAIRVMREWAQRTGAASMDMPVVFTSALGYDRAEGFLDHNSWLRPIGGLSQTPQTWLDHQVYESADALHYNWDAVEALFERPVLQGMFDQYGQLLQRLAREPDAWQLPWAVLVPRHLSGKPARSANIDVSPSVGGDQVVMGEASAVPHELVARIRAEFAELTGKPIAVRQNFFEAGASSLNLVQLHVRLEQSGYTGLVVTDMFSYPSPQQLAAHLAEMPVVAEQVPIHTPHAVERSEQKTPVDRGMRRAEPIAVIGLAGRFPGARDVDQFWRNLVEGKVVSQRLSRHELIDAGVDETTIDADNFVNVGAVLEDADCFDAALFGYSRQEAESIDPQQRLFLQGVWHALEHAGYAPRQVPHMTGVFGSARMSTYPVRDSIRVTDISQVRGMQALMGNDKDYLATRAAYKLDLKGPAFTVQTACSSSLVAVHVACESLRAGECDMAVAGGVGVSFPQRAGYLYQPGMIFSPDGACRPFDVAGQGTFAGHGLGLVTLRRLDDALRDGDPIIAVLKGSAINNDGHAKVGFTAPSMAGQRDVIRQAMKLAGVRSDDIGMIEAHGTATPMGDPIEVAALREVFKDRAPAAGSCALGSLKGNMGHLDTAAGIAALIKAVLAVRHGTIPPVAHFTRPNPELQLEHSPFHVPVHAEAWSDVQRTAGVSSFGIGGTNCHVVVQSLSAEFAASHSRRETSGDGMPVPLLLSAASETALRRLAGAYAAAWDASSANDLAFTALHGRQLDLDHRLALSVLDEAPQALAAFADGEDDPLLYYGAAPKRGKLAWVFTGLGAQWQGMGRELYRRSPAFAQTLDRCLAACPEPLASGLRIAMLGDCAPMERADLAHPAIVAFELSMAAHWSALGLRPDVVLGHSWGEYAASAVAGYYSIEQVMSLAATSGALTQRAGAGGMLSVFAETSAVEALARQYSLEIAAYNSERHVVVTGASVAVDALVAELQQRGVRHRRHDSRFAAHSVLLESVLAEFADKARSMLAGKGDITWVSGLLGSPVDGLELGRSDYWVRHLREPTKYKDAVACLTKLGVGTCLELGPDATLSDMGARHAQDGMRWIAATRREEPVWPVLEDAIAQLFAAGWDLPWKTLFTHGGKRCHAPLYVFDEQRYWWSAETARMAAAVDTSPIARLLVGTGADSGIEAGRSVSETAAASLDMPRLDAFYACLVQLHNIYVDKMVRRCLLLSEGEASSSWPDPFTSNTADARGVDALSLLRSGRLLPRYRQLLVRLLDASVEDGYYRCIDGRYQPARRVPHERLGALLTELRSYCEGLDSIADTVARAGENLFAMMSGQVEPVAIIFPSGQSAGVEVLYQDFSFGRYFNQIAAGVLAGWLQQRKRGDDARRPLRILEVGGGTGGTTAWLLPELAGQSQVRYDFTDISPLFTRRAEQKFAAYDVVHYREFDLQSSAIAQGFEAESYDIIVAANVVHATQHIGRTLANLRQLLKPGGRLLLREITRQVRLFDFVFGPLVLPLHDEDAREGKLFLTTSGWEKHCIEAGFESVQWLPDDSNEATRICEHILVAQCPGSAHDQMIGEAGTHSAQSDWSDIVVDPARYRQRLQQACDAWIERIGHGGTRPRLPNELLQPPAWLGHVRSSWSDGLFGAARIDFEAIDAHGRWLPLAQASSDEAAIEDLALPASREAIDTCFEWRWEALATPLPLQRRVDGIGLPDALVQQLAALPATAGERPLQCFVAGDESPAEIAAALRQQLIDDPASDWVIVTRDAWMVGAGAAVDPSHHALWGFLRVAASEYPQRVMAAVDIAGDAPWDDVLLGLAAVAAGHRWIAVRNKAIHTQRLRAREQVSRHLPAQALRGERWHVVTGAFGGLGRFALRWLAAQGARRIALLAPRMHADWPSMQEELQHRYGCELRWLACDVADENQLHHGLDSLIADGGIEGAIHAAGILDDAPLASLDASRLHAVFAVKASAARWLCEALHRCRASYVLLFSSAAAALGPSGQGAHALACAYLDGLAASRQHAADRTSPRVISIAWGAWGEIGRAADPALQALLASRGMLTLETAEGRWHLEQAIVDGAPYRLAMRLACGGIDVAGPGIATAPALPASTELLSAEPSVVSPDTPRPVAESLVTRDWLVERIRAQLRMDAAEPLDPAQDLLQLGLDSLLFLELSSEIEEQFGVRLNASSAYGNLSVNGLCELILAHSTASSASPSAVWLHDAERRYQPFPLTPIQHAYWLGRTDLIGYGGVACHVLFEWDLSRDFDLNRFEQAWNVLVRQHDMLRMVIDQDGQQRILERVPDYRFQRENLRSLANDERQARLQRIRDDMSYRVLPTDRWPLFEVAVSLLDERHYRLHMNLDLLQFDTQSFKVMMDDLGRAYAGEPVAAPALTFRDYVMADLAERESQAWKTSWIYWQDRLPWLPPAPALPLAAVAPHGQPRLSAYQHRINAPAWARIRQVWQSWRATPSAALLAVFARVLERWARHPDFTLNLTFFQRKPYHPDVSRLIGDFTSVLLVDFSIAADESLRDTIEHVQSGLWNHMAHADINGVELLRELGRHQQGGTRPLMPMVFTSMLGMSLDGLPIDQALGSLLGDPVHMFTQTPQVWLDHQVMEVEGELICNWFCMDEVFSPGLAQAMFADYVAVLDAIVADPALQDLPATALSIDAHRHREDGIAAELRSLEQQLRSHPAVRQAQIDESGAELVVSVVADDSHVAAATTPGVPSNMLLPELDGAVLAEVQVAWEYLEAKALAGMAQTLLRHGLFVSPDASASLDEVVSRLNAKPGYRRLLHQWLELLRAKGWLDCDGQHYRATRSLTHIPTPAPAAFHADWSSTLATYLDACVAHHDALLCGTQSPLGLLFGNDDAVTRSLYQDHPAIACLNRGAAMVARALAEVRGSLDVLEVGGGTAATTQQLLPALEGKLRGYTFTDVSTLFLDDARSRFGDTAPMHYALLDINRPVDFEEHPSAGYDLIVAANVLHDATHVRHALRRLGRLLKPGGYLLLIEATERDSAMQLASVGFIEGLSAYQDARLFDDKAMLTASMWRDALLEAGFELERQSPSAEKSPTGQHLLLARATRIARLDTGSLQHYLKPSPMASLPPMRWIQRESLPLAAVASSVKSPAKPSRNIEVTARNSRPVETAVIDVWTRLLGRRVDRGSDFFKSGGDSLMATRMVGQLNQLGFGGASLQNLFSQPVLEDFCASLHMPTTVSGDTSVLLADHGGNDAVFIMHASDGDPSACLALAGHFDGKVYGLQALDLAGVNHLADLAKSHLQAMRNRQPHGPYLLVGWSYGAFVALDVARQLRELGEVTHLVLLDPVCRSDFQAADRSALLKMLADGPVPLVLPADFDGLSEAARIDAFLHSAKAARLAPFDTGAVTAMAALERVEKLMRLLDAPAGPNLSAPCLWISAEARPGHWRPAEDEWRDLVQGCSRVSLPSDHWQLVMDKQHSHGTFEAIATWRKHMAAENAS